MIPKIQNVFKKIKKVIITEHNNNNTRPPANEIKQELGYRNNFPPKEFIINNLARVLPVGTFIVMDDKRNVFISNSEGTGIYYETNDIEPIIESDSGKRIYRIIQNSQLNGTAIPLKNEKSTWVKICPPNIIEVIEKVVEVEKEIIVEKTVPVKKEIPIIKETDTGMNKVLDKFKETEKISMPIMYPKEYVEENIAESVDLLLSKSGLDSIVSKVTKNLNRNIRAYLHSLNEIDIINTELQDTTMYAVFCQSQGAYSFGVLKGDKRKVCFQINPKEKLTKTKVLDYIEKNKISKHSSLVFVSLQNKNGIEHLMIHDLVSLSLGGKVDYLII